MEETLVSPILEILLRKLRSLLKKQEVNSVDEIELKKMDETLSPIKDVLPDAEDRQHGDDDVHQVIRKWLEDLKSVCYDAEDVLDELEIGANDVKKEQHGSISTSKVCNFISCACSTSKHFPRVDSKIKEVRKRLEGIAADKNKFDFKDRKLGNRNICWGTEMTTNYSFLVASDHSFVIDMIEDREKIIESLRTFSTKLYQKTVEVIPIVGTGGLGKTTLAKLVYDDKRIDGFFDYKMWIQVSEEFFEKKIIVDIINIASGSKKLDRNIYLDEYQQELANILNGKRYLLVMDDVWNINSKKWVWIQNLLWRDVKGSKIIVTTRNIQVGLIMGSRKNIHHLEYLPYSICLHIFNKCAFREGEVIKPSLKRIAEEIVKKCRGIPLAVRTLGRALYYSRDEKDWMQVRDDKIWSKPVEDEEILPELVLSYYLRPRHLKQCFSYCCVFPKGYGLNNVILIQFWMAHGLLQSENENEEPESIGMRYIEELRFRSFFQHFEQHFDFLYFQMPEVVHELAAKFAKNECFVIEYPSFILPAGGIYRWLMLVQLEKQMIRSILFFGMGLRQSVVESYNISRFPNLRLLDLRNYGMEELPESIDNLKHLRYLNLTKNIKIKRLPNSIFRLTRLETLLLGGCKELEELPREIKQLVNLRTLVLTSKQKHLLENGIGCLTSLRRLVIGSCCNLEKLFSDIDQLRSLRTLIIGNCPNLASLPHGVIKLRSLEKLMIHNRLTLKEETVLPNYQELGSLVPHLRMLCIDGFKHFQGLPQWLLQCPANTLEWLAIKNCPDLNCLPLVSHDIFKSLQVLEISNCPKLSSLPKDMHRLTAMRELKIRNCPALTKACENGQVKIPRIELDGKVK